MTDIFSAYERGLDELLRRLGQDHPRYAEVLTFQARLAENIASARHHGDSENLRAERSRVLQQLNQVSLDELEFEFRQMFGTAESKQPTPRSGFLHSFEWQERITRLRIVLTRMVGPVIALLVSMGIMLSVFWLFVIRSFPLT